ncbi:hypothetical protein HBI56_016010 [Parastagonospora nodorum]|uniref:DUF7730 domain-containing protein n=1 Tax=Phaeosphaeria nodorum (strain SN15 / ATCC MYA-4574 / FGSC 10173) TaxID=321614 RepID=A0A7U2HYP2_PHANO|nr:hypothetical protein HBH56_083970 [Parastagonospora nodorum]QRC96780.1 hypothetical protein JI435_016720 [Parastagonospora nodorum SN15]KAH3930077.1 hypothetical protein HBH54_117850 [Parastagonospora nodorum]KAH3955438.1 hypothetical protein HBH53_006700 [Parastagonospora nodorum]KAH3976823.1 hypothetical protein HBH51_074790 [Parastagonospora nodorum]
MNDAGMWESSERTDGDVMNLLRTCRDIYSECIDHVYMQNTFSFSDFFTFSVFHNVTLPNRFDRIQHLHIAQTYKWDFDHAFQLGRQCTTCPVEHMFEYSWAPRDEYTWQTTWDIIARMPSLKTLDVLLHWEDSHLHHSMQGTLSEQDELNLLEQRFFAPMANVRTAGLLFEVRVNWPGEFYSAPSPFKVVRNTTGFDIPDEGSRFVRAS